MAIGWASPWRPAGWWATGEYMLVWRKERYFPPLVTSNPPDTVFESGIIGEDATRVIFGNEYRGSSPESGWRGDGGIWLSTCIAGGVGGFWISREIVKFHRESGSGFPILARPYNEAFPPPSHPAAVVLANPTLFGEDQSAMISVKGKDSIWSADAYIRYRLLPGRSGHLDLLGGFFYANIEDTLKVHSEARDLEFITTIFFSNVVDNFKTSNHYYAGLLGVNSEWCLGCWRLLFIGKVALGNITHETRISGSTHAKGTFTNVNVHEGFLAEPTNIGHHTSHHFNAVPYMSASLEYKFGGCLGVTAGYSFLYWQRVEFAAEQVSLNINTSQSNGFPLTGKPVPRFPNRTSSFWLQAATFGVALTY